MVKMNKKWAAKWLTYQLTNPTAILYNTIVKSQTFAQKCL